MKRQATNCEEIFANPISLKGFAQRIYKELLKLNSQGKKTEQLGNNRIKKKNKKTKTLAKPQYSHTSKENIQMEIST